MTQNKILSHIKLDERNYVEKPSLAQFDRPSWDIIALMQDLLTGKKRVIPLLNETEVANL